SPIPCPAPVMIATLPSSRMSPALAGCLARSGEPVEKAARLPSTIRLGCTKSPGVIQKREGRRRATMAVQPQDHRAGSSHRDSIDRADRRWLAAWVGMFLTVMLLFAGMH